MEKCLWNSYDKIYYCDIVSLAEWSLYGIDSLFRISNDLCSGGKRMMTTNDQIGQLVDALRSTQMTWWGVIMPGSTYSFLIIWDWAEAVADWDGHEVSWVRKIWIDCECGNRMEGRAFYPFKHIVLQIISIWYYFAFLIALICGILSIVLQFYNTSIWRPQYSR